jgi:hypothetical protein
MLNAASRAGVVQHQPPALRRLEENVGGEYPRRLRAFGGADVHTFEHMVHGAAGVLDTAHLLRPHRDRPVGEHRIERGPHRAVADDARSARVYAGHVVVVGPGGHQALDVAALQRFVELRFDVVH